MLMILFHERSDCVLLLIVRQVSFHSFLLKVMITGSTQPAFLRNEPVLIAASKQIILGHLSQLVILFVGSCLIATQMLQAKQGSPP